MIAERRYMLTTRVLLFACWVMLVEGLIAAPFGRVIPIGGQAADLALDEPRGVLYIANFTANRIEVMSLADGSIQTSINVAPQPGSLSLSPDGKWLLIAHYGATPTGTSPRNSLTLIDLVTNSRQNFVLSAAPLGVAFGLDGQALVVTATDFLLFDPLLGTTRQLATVEGVVAKTIPQPTASFPSQFTTASVNVSGDGLTIYGLTDTIRFRYDVNNKGIYSVGYTSSPAQAPRVVSVNHDGSRVAMGWALHDRRGVLIAQHPNALGLLNVGGHVVDSARGVIYTQVPPAAVTAPTTPTTPTTPITPTTPGTGTASGTPAGPVIEQVLQVVDIDNLAVRERIQLAENLAGKGVLSADNNTAYVISDSGVTILPVGQLGQAQKLTTSVQDLMFLGNFCDRRISTQEFTLSDPSGAATDFAITSTIPGVSISPASGTTPAVIRVSIDPNTYSNTRGTTTGRLNIRSTAALNVPPSVRLLINNREPDQRGSTVNISGTLVDVIADPARDRFFVLRQNTNEVLVFDGTTYQQTATLKTGNTPTQMAISFDRRWLVIGADNSQIAHVYDLETLQPSTPITMPPGHYPRSVAASGRAMLAASRVAGPIHTIDRIDLLARTATQLPTLGVWENNVDINTVLVASGNGSRILAAQSTGGMMLYDGNADTFTISRKDYSALSGAFAASSFDQFVVGNLMFNSSLVATRRFDAGAGQPSGFTFVDQSAIRTTAAAADAPGVIQRVNLTSGADQRATRIIESPVLPTLTQPFTRSIAVLPSRSNLVSLTVSGVTVLPWNYDASVAPPKIERVVNAADFQRTVAPGGLVTITGQNMSPVNVATRQMPLPTALGESCLTVNGVPMPLIFVSDKQVNAQLPFNIDGNATMILRTPGGVSDNFNLQILPTAPGIFRQQVEGVGELPVITASRNGQPVSGSNPVKREDHITIFLTGMGRTNPQIEEGLPSPDSPRAKALVEPKMTLGGHALTEFTAELSPGQVGVYEIHVWIPRAVPTGNEIPLVVEQGGVSTTVSVRVIN
jgi:uncharacterized protein (TIGR03437 family)